MSKKLIKKLVIYLRLLKRVPLRYIINFITTPILFLQLFYLINEYFQYPTVQDTEFPLLETNASINNKNMISAKEFPAISLCHRIDMSVVFFDTKMEMVLAKTLDMINIENISSIEQDEAVKKMKYVTDIIYHNKTIDENIRDLISNGKMMNIFLNSLNRKWTKIFFGENFFNIERVLFYNDFHRYPAIRYFPFLAETFIKYIVINSLDEFEHKIQLITDIDRYGLNGTIDLFRFFNIHRFVEAKSGSEWVRLLDKQLSLTPYGMCITLSP